MCPQKAFFVLLVIFVCSYSVIATQRSTFEFEVEEITAIESPYSTSFYRVRIIRTGNLGHPASVVLSTEDGTATGTNDFTACNQRIDFATNQSLVVWEAQIHDEGYPDTYEGTEWFLYKLSSPSSNSVIGPRSTLTVRIDDSDDYPEINVDGIWIVEPGVGRQRQTTLRVTLTNPSLELVSANLISDGGTATEGADYSPFSTTVNFSPMDQEEFVPLTILGDGLPELQEEIHLKLSNLINVNPGFLVQNKVWIINAAPYSGQSDFNGDGAAEDATFDSATLRWRRISNQFYYQSPVAFGSPGDVIVPGEYTGDAITDIAVWRPATGQWFVLRSEDGSYFAFEFGLNGDIPVPADYDADGIADFAVYRPSTGTWYIERSTDRGIEVRQFGVETDKPVPADYDGDWKADLAVFRGNGVASAQWWILNSGDGNIAVNHFGQEGDKIVPMDYTGDGKADLSFWRPSTEDWYVLNSADNSVSVRRFGVGDPNSIPAPGQYGHREFSGGPKLALLAPGNSTTPPLWHMETIGGVGTRTTIGDRPLAGAYVR